MHYAQCMAGMAFSNALLGIQIHHMQVVGALRLMLKCGLQRGERIFFFLVIVALCEPDTAAVDDVNGGKNFHFSILKQFSNSILPTFALFSG